MDKKILHEILEHNICSLMLNEECPTPSMRYLSTCIGDSKGYIQKILNSDYFPSVEKLIQIADYYDIEPWMLLYDCKDKDILSILQALEKCPAELFPTIISYIEFLLQNSCSFSSEHTDESLKKPSPHSPNALPGTNTTPDFLNTS